jgi:hypothetical protein
MSLHFHSWTRWQIHRLFAGGLPPSRNRALLRQVCACPECSAVFRRYHASEAMLCAEQGEPNRLAAERMAAAVFGSMPAQKAETTSSRGALGLMAPAVALACAALVVFAGRSAQHLSQRVPVGRDSRLAPASVMARGQGAAPNSEVGFRLLRLLPREAKVDETPALALSDVVTFTYTNLGEGTRYLALLGIQEDGAVRWYYPGPESSQSIPIEMDRVDEPLNDGIRLSVFHSAGWMRVTAIFSKQPIEKATVERAVRDLASRAGALEGLEPLPLSVTGSIEDSIRVELAPAGGGAPGGIR